MSRRGAILMATAAIVLASAAPASADLPPGYHAKPVITGLYHPSTVRFARDGRIFVSEQTGEVLEYDGFSDHTPTPVADIRTEVYDNGERGLLGMALDPDFPVRPYLYLLYSYDAPPGGTAPTYGTPGTSGDPCTVDEASGYCLSSGRISRLKISRSSHVSGERVLLDGWCGQFDSHSVGTLAFDARGRLYAGAGDGANFNSEPDYGEIGSPPNPCGDPGGADPTIPTAQGGSLRAQDLFLGHDPVGLDGSIIRLNPRTGAGAAANPLAKSSDPNARRIIAYGFRNPFRFTVDPRTQKLWVGDVGWGRSEEIDHVDPDDLRDYGWPCYEGVAVQGHWASLGLDACKRLYQSHAAKLPVFTYDHAEEVVRDDGCSPDFGSALSGVAVETGHSFSKRYRHALFFEDVDRGCIWAMQTGANGKPDPHRVGVFATGVGSPVDLEFGPGGALYYVNIYAGTVMRISGPDSLRAAG